MLDDLGIQIWEAALYHPFVFWVSIVFVGIVGIAAWGERPRRPVRRWQACAKCPTPHHCAEWDGCLNDRGGIGHHGAAREAGD